MSTPRRRRWTPASPLVVGQTWGTLRRGAGDPAWTVRAGTLWRGIRTPLGPVTLGIAARDPQAPVLARAWGPGSEWVLEHLPRMLGEEDDDSGFTPRHPVVRDAARRHPGWRVPRTGLVLESLLPAVVEQKVTGQEAFAGWRRIVHRAGERAPGPGAELGLWVPPGPTDLAALPSWEWLRAGVSPQRSATLARVVQVAARLEECTGMSSARARARITSVPGVGVWTAAETAHRALGDPDAVSFGDYHVAADIGWALTGSPVDDHALVELLAPYAGHRYRVQRLLQLAGVHRPRRGPRMAPRTHLPVSRAGDR